MSASTTIAGNDPQRDEAAGGSGGLVMRGIAMLNGVLTLPFKLPDGLNGIVHFFPLA
ncbi:hypothetical protein JQ633_29335 [Bradyrhizobium tropiciagri]|uniref:hypothetical protein n=1 Tax=Bradyrhizobium tropiciagri TaxID=312253 RepID=UPI001BA6091B|nr:hypothetical protein [Bradyrhizobium tropiciagri]MBR0874492.1 hypothetical protein [Bradyrhizobium tropiciagri]